jgi:LysM repeat protein
VDIENRVRREHSTTASSFGVRRGDFTDSAGNFHFGSVFRVSAGETLSRIARRCGLTTAQITTNIFRENGDPVTAATMNSIRAGERLLIEGVFWHEVISGETMSAIATIWGIPLASLIRANPQIADPNRIRPGQMLLIPAT